MLGVPVSASAQRPAPTPRLAPQISEEMQAAYRERQRCMEDNRAAHQRHIAANELIVLRDNREQIERELPTNASLRAQMPTGYADFVAATFAR